MKHFLNLQFTKQFQLLYYTKYLYFLPLEKNIFGPTPTRNWITFQYLWWAIQKRRNFYYGYCLWSFDKEWRHYYPLSQYCITALFHNFCHKFCSTNPQHCRVQTFSNTVRTKIKQVVRKKTRTFCVHIIFTCWITLELFMLLSTKLFNVTGDKSGKLKLSRSENCLNHIGSFSGIWFASFKL